MRDREEFEQKLALWTRIQDGTASPEDHGLAMAWGDQHRIDALKNAGPIDKWMMTTGVKLMQAWPFPAIEGKSAQFTYEQILLFAILYGKSDIENGGLQQFFGNHTGDCALETVQGLESVKAFEASRVLRDAMSLFGAPYPRERTRRCDKLPSLLNELAVLTDSFYDSLPPKKDFDAACEYLLQNARETGES